MISQYVTYIAHSFLNVRDETDLEQDGKAYRFHSLSWQ